MQLHLVNLALAPTACHTPASARTWSPTQELFETLYFCKDQDPTYFDLARPLGECVEHGHHSDPHARARTHTHARARAHTHTHARALLLTQPRTVCTHIDGHPVIARFSKLAKELAVVLPFSYFERDGNAHFNSLVVIDADGSVLDNYRKAHIPDGPGYQVCRAARALHHTARPCSTSYHHSLSPSLARKSSTSHPETRDFECGTRQLAQ